MLTVRSLGMQMGACKHKVATTTDYQLLCSYTSAIFRKYISTNFTIAIFISQAEGFTSCMKMSSLVPMKMYMCFGQYWWNRMHLLCHRSNKASYSCTKTQT